MKCKNGCPRPRFRSTHECLLCLQWRRGIGKTAVPGFGYTPFLHQVSKSKKCWEWMGPKNAAGYGLYRSPTKQTYMAHRASYGHYRGHLIAGMQIDHLCKNRGCVNPEHLEQVTPQENIRRRDHDRKSNQTKD